MAFKKSTHFSKKVVRPEELCSLIFRSYVRQYLLRSDVLRNFFNGGRRSIIIIYIYGISM